MKSSEEVLSEYYLGQTIKYFEYGSSGDGSDSVRSLAIGKMITRVRFGFNDSREDVGILISVQDVDDPIFVYDNEKIIFEE